MNSGAEDEFILLIEEHHPLLVRIAGYYTREPHRQEDLYQEIVYELWKSFGTYEGSAAFSTWMYRVAVNTCISFLRKRNSRVSLVFWKESLAELVSDCDNTDPVVVNEEKKLLYDHIEQLDELDRTLVLLWLEGLEYETIAKISGLSSSTVGVRLHRIRKKLKSMIQTHTGDHGS